MMTDKEYIKQLKDINKRALEACDKSVEANSRTLRVIKVQRAIIFGLLAAIIVRIVIDIIIVFSHAR